MLRLPRKVVVKPGSLFLSLVLLSQISGLPALSLFINSKYLFFSNEIVQKVQHVKQIWLDLL